MSGEALAAIDQVDDILERFYVDKEALADHEQEDLAFYDLYDNEAKSAAFSPNRAGLWTPLLERNDSDTDPQNLEVDKGKEQEPPSRGIALAEVNRRLTIRQENVSGTQAVEESDGDECVNDRSEGEFVKEGDELHDQE
ncbi:hypothetical protein LshimejAT787_0805700 [Lyophyllum shimeji]|uniref:Uncharacterized protein n=1 Tax=Lyophyllum shimeji TaxID=47721 RepID=A0A9P3PSD8_LYOSH|nr:hypothetical protein LshimejAT787_0805700 [Lyophyllum shimeji]